MTTSRMIPRRMTLINMTFEGMTDNKQHLIILIANNRKNGTWQSGNHLNYTKPIDTHQHVSKLNATQQSDTQ
jgi:hypothetical protein